MSNSVHGTYNKSNQVMQSAEHNTEVTEIVHCYQLNCKQSNIHTPIKKTHNLIHHGGRDEVVRDNR